METGFLESWNNNFQYLSTVTIISWNIHGAKNKLESRDVFSFLCAYDIICLHEIKTALEIHLPGYVCYRGRDNDMHRGGSAIMIKNALSRYVESVRILSSDCLLMRMKNLPGITLATCYVPPDDSPYHTFALITDIKNEMQENSLHRINLIGD